MRPLRGDWRPHRTHPVLLGVQLAGLWQAGLRGLDYVGGVDAGLDSRAAEPAYGWLLYGSTILVLLGLAVRRGGPVILGHALLASWYTGLGASILNASGVAEPVYVASGLLLSAGGTYVLLSERAPTPHRIAAVVLMVGGQAFLAWGLGGDYRTGTSLLSVGLQHAILAVGTFVLWQRDRLRRVVEHEAP